jgi:hypothetical protein
MRQRYEQGISASRALVNGAHGGGGEVCRRVLIIMMVISPVGGVCGRGKSKPFRATGAGQAMQAGLDCE